MVLIFHFKCTLTHYQTTNFRLFQTDDNFKFDENGRKLSKRVENTVGKGEIARYEQFLLFPQFFQKACSQGRQKVSLYGNGLKCHLQFVTIWTRIKFCCLVMDSQMKSLWPNCGFYSTSKMLTSIFCFSCNFFFPRNILQSIL